VLVMVGRNRDHTSLSSNFSGQGEQNRDNPSVSNIIRAKEMSLKPFWDKKKKKIELLSSDVKKQV
jgi:hypothetical protein